jgi:uncharacterized protein YdhG (YjbR/CyaY superfamily)
MDSKKNTAADVREYIAGFPKEVQSLLQTIRSTIKNAAPNAVESISYKMPAYKYFGVLVYFAGYKNHIGFYPGSSGIAEFKKELSVYKGAKGSVQFPLDKPIPVSLVRKIIKFRVNQNIEKEKGKNKK